MTEHALIPKVAIVIGGPTAVGKTEIGERVAEILDGEIISADSRQIYRGLDIGTAKPVDSPVRHHLLDVVSPQERFNAAEFVRRALEVMDSLRARGKVPIIVGGTGLYIRALTVGFFPGDFKSEQIRRQLAERYRRGEDLYAYLKQVDPVAAEKIDPRTYVRIERALEVYLVSGKPISYWWRHATKPPSDWKFVKFFITMEREKLYERIARRTEKMLESGWIDEVRRLLEQGVPPDSPGLTSIGYRQIVRYLQGEIDYETMKQEIIRETKNYAKRQITWFKKEPDCVLIGVTDMSAEESARQIVNCYRRALSE